MDLLVYVFWRKINTNKYVSDNNNKSPNICSILMQTFSVLALYTCTVSTLWHINIIVCDVMSSLPTDCHLVRDVFWYEKTILIISDWLMWKVFSKGTNHNYAWINDMLSCLRISTDVSIKDMDILATAIILISSSGTSSYLTYFLS